MIKVSIRNEKSRNKKRPIKPRCHPALVNHTFVVLVKCSQFPTKWRSCAFWQYKGSCGNSRGITKLVRLGDCNDNVMIVIINHLTSCHLSREKMTEHELILARAGVFELPPSKAGKMFICPKHRHSLGKYWKQRRPCHQKQRCYKCSDGKGDYETLWSDCPDWIRLVNLVHITLI